MSTATLTLIEEYLRQLSSEKQQLVLAFVADLARKQEPAAAFSTMLASEAVLRRDWDRPEEEEAWKEL